MDCTIETLASPSHVELAKQVEHYIRYKLEDGEVHVTFYNVPKVGHVAYVTWLPFKITETTVEKVENYE